MSVKISELTAADTLTGTEEVPLVQSLTTKKITVNDLLPVQLQENKAIDLNSHKLTFGDEENRIELDITDANSKIFQSIVEHETGDGNYVNIFGNATPTGANMLQYASFNDGETQAEIDFNAQASGAALTYTADTHTINGAIITPNVIALDFANDGAAASGGVAVGQWYHTSGALKIRLA